MKIFIFFVSILVISLFGIGETKGQSVQWAKGAGDAPSPTMTCTDRNGNVYVAGNFGGNVAIFGGDSVTGWKSR